MLAPFMAITHAGYQLYADRYSYLVSLALAVVVGAWAASVARAWETGRLAPRTAGLGATLLTAGLAALGAMSVRQMAVWHDPATLWGDAIAVEPECSVCHAKLGELLLARGAPEAALAHFRRTVELRPDRVRVRIPMAEALVQVGRLDEAVTELRRVLDR